MISIIHSPSGITLFSRIFENFCEKINNDLETDLIGSFISAIRKFSKNFGQDEIKQIEMSTLKFIIYEKEKILIFFLLDNSDKRLDYEKSLKICLNIFLEMFYKDNYTPYNSTSSFKKFNPILQEILKISPEKIEPSCLSCPRLQKNNCLFKHVQEEILKSNEILRKKKKRI